MLHWIGTASWRYSSIIVLLYKQDCLMVGTREPRTIVCCMHGMGTREGRRGARKRCQYWMLSAVVVCARKGNIHRGKGGGGG